MKGLQQEKKELERKLESLQHNDIAEESLMMESDAHDNVDLDEVDLDNQPQGILGREQWDDHPHPLKSTRVPLTSQGITSMTKMREPLAGLSSVQIMEDDFEDDFITQAKPFRSDWTLPNSKKRKAPLEKKHAPQLKFPLKMDSKGRLQGTVQLGSRKKMTK